MKKIFLLFSLALIILSACKKDDSSIKEPEAANIVRIGDKETKIGAVLYERHEDFVSFSFLTGGEERGEDNVICHLEFSKPEKQTKAIVSYKDPIPMMYFYYVFDSNSWGQVYNDENLNDSESFFELNTFIRRLKLKFKARLGIAQHIEFLEIPIGTEVEIEYEGKTIPGSIAYR